MPRDAPPAPSHQRAHGRAELGLQHGPGGTRIAHLFQSAPLRLLFPDSDPGDPKLAALVNVAGGLAGGDRLEVALRLGEGARLTATTPAAEKVYRSLGPETEIASSLDLGAGSLCEWLPQETILFDGARLARRLDIALAPGARLLAAEMLVLGRAARGETLRSGALHDRWRIRREGRLVWADTLRLADPPATTIAGRFTLGGAGALATLLLLAPEAAALRDLARELAAVGAGGAGATGGAGLVAPGLLVARWAGEAGAVRAGLGAAIAALRAEAFGLPATLPRLWRS